MTTVRWTSKGAWEHLLNKVFQTSDTLPFFAFSVGCENIDDFMYLTRGDFETSFQVTSSDDEGQPVFTSQTLSRVLIGKLLRAQKWFDNQPERAYETWSTLDIETLNSFR